MSRRGTRDPVAHVRKHFRRLYLKAIPRLHNGTGAYLSFSAVFSGIEALAGLYYGKTADGEARTRFETFVTKYFDLRYKSRMKELWKLRNSLAHSFAVDPNFSLVNGRPKQHFAMHGTQVQLNAESLFQDFSRAAEQYFRDLVSDPTLHANFIRVCQDRGIIDTSEHPSLVVSGNANSTTSIVLSNWK
jgi:hypothetical protein